MHRLLNGVLILVVFVMCGCDGGRGAQPSAVAPHVAAAPMEIQQVLLAGEGGGINSPERPKMVTRNTPISITVFVGNPAATAAPISLRLVDLKDGQVVGEQTQALTTGQNSLRFEFKPVKPWSEGRHLLEARIEANGKVFQREFDVLPTEPSASP